MLNPLSNPILELNSIAQANLSEAMVMAAGAATITIIYGTCS